VLKGKEGRQRKRRERSGNQAKEGIISILSTFRARRKRNHAEDRENGGELNGNGRKPIGSISGITLGKS